MEPKNSCLEKSKVLCPKRTEQSETCSWSGNPTELPRSALTSSEKQSQLWIYLLPVVGILPAIWTLYRRTGNLEQQKTSRLSLMLVLLWLTGYISLFVGAANSSEMLTFRLLYANTLLTSGYFLICLGLMFRLRTGKSPYLPLLSQVANQIGRKYK